jgi:hypothetical protein
MAQEEKIFALCRPAVPLRNIAGDRDRRPSQLVGQAESLGVWKTRRESIDSHRQLDGSLPNHEILE